MKANLLNFLIEFFISKSDFLSGVKNRIFGIYFQKQKLTGIKSLSKF